MMSMACGLAATGKVPYASTFAIFAAGRAYDQVRLGIAHNELKVRIGASHGGVSLGEDGASHAMIEDIALMRAMPRMQVVVPADYNQAYRAVIDSYEQNDEPMYMRFGRPVDPDRLRRDPRDARRRRRRDPRGQGHQPDRHRPHGLARARGRRGARARGRGRGRGAQRLIVKPLALRAGARVAVEDRRRRDRRGAPGRRRPRRRRPPRSPPSSTRCRSSPSAWATSSASRAPARPAWSTSGSRPRGIADRAREALLLKPIVSRPPLFGPEWT